MRIHLLLALLLATGSLYGHMVRDHEKEVVIDTTSQLMWQDCRKSDTLVLNWDAAREYCATLSFAGYDDWRLPAKTELLTIIDPEKQKVNTMHPVNEHFLHAHSDVYWSSDDVASDTALAWRVNFDEAKPSWGAKRFEFHVRCVRSHISR